MILCISGTLYAANKYYSNEIVYNTSDGKTMNVNEALNNLYSDYNLLKKTGDATASQILKGKTAIVNGKKVTGTLEQKNSINKITQLTYSNSNQNTRSVVTASKSYTFTQDYSNVQITSFIAAGNGASDISGNSVTIQVNNGAAEKSTVVSSGQSYTFVSSSVAIRVAHIAYTHNLTNIKSGDVVKINYSVSYPSGGTQAHFDSIIYGV